MRFRTALIWNAISQFGQSGIQFLSTIILARLLTPNDFGIIGIVTIFITFSQMIVDSEMGGALLRKKEVSKTDYSTLFFYNLGVSIILYLILFFVAPLISSFYHKIELTNIIRILSFSVIIHAFRVVQKIMIFRALQFRQMAIINIISGITSLFVAIIFAKLGYGYWSLIWQQIIMACMNVVLMSFHNRFLPELTFDKASFKYQFGFGISLLGSDTIKTIANNISTNIIAKISTLDFTGYYTQSNRITSFCQSSLGSLMDQSIFPMMARIDDSDKVSKLYHQIFYILCISLSIITIFFIQFSEKIISIVLGHNWLDAEWIFQILCLSILPTSIQVLGRNLFKVIAATNLVFYLEIIKSVIVISALFFATFVGTIYVVWSVVFAQSISCIIWIITIEKELSKPSYLSLSSFIVCGFGLISFYFILQ